MGRPKRWGSQAEYQRDYRLRRKQQQEEQKGYSLEEVAQATANQKLQLYVNGGIPEEWYQRVEKVWGELKGLSQEEYWRMVDAH